MANINEENVTISGRKWDRIRAAGLSNAYGLSPTIEWWTESITIDETGAVIDRQDTGNIPAIAYNPDGVFPVVDPTTGATLTAQQIAYLANAKPEQMLMCLLYSKGISDLQNRVTP